MSFATSTLATGKLPDLSHAAGMYAMVTEPLDKSPVPADFQKKSHHLANGKGFKNPWDSFQEMSPLTLMLRGFLWRKITGQVNHPDTTPPTVPVRTPAFLPSRTTPSLRSTWLGHACYYIEFPSGLRVLFDPVFEDCCAPINLKALRRYTPPPCEIEDLPFVDAVVISHNHYDHLSYPSIQRITKRFPDAHFFAPLGNKEWFVSSGVNASQVTELDWWEEREVALYPCAAKPKSSFSSSVESAANEKNTETPITARISALPCQHTSARGPFDRNRTLWASWSVSSGTTPSTASPASVYFAGDTGYRTIPRVLPQNTPISSLPTCPAFSQIGSLRGPFTLGLIPIGAYQPRWMFSNVHADPDDAVHIFRDTKCRNGLGMHWGTWVLTEEEVREPPVKLEEACKEQGVAEGRFGVCEIGESREFV